MFTDWNSRLPSQVKLKQIIEVSEMINSNEDAMQLYLIIKNISYK
jgi:hypothetical protein